MVNKFKYFISKLIYPRIKQKGDNNNIEISNNSYLRKSRIYIYGSHNTIIIKDRTYLHNVNIKIGFPDCPINNCKIIIDKDTSFNSANIQLGESGSSVLIGENCMFSFGIEITCTDTHSITDTEGNLINKGESIEIGSNVWIGKNAIILKNTKIPNNCIIAQNSIVTNKFYKDSCILAGIPAKIVKEDILWSRKRPQQYIDNKE